MEYMGQPYEMIEYEVTDGPEFSKASWFDVKFKLGLPYPNLPYLMDEDVKLTETIAIHRYLADKYMPELLGRTESDRAEVTMLEGIICGSGLKNAVTHPCYANEKDKSLKAIKDKLPAVVNYIKGKKFLIGNEPVWLDFYFFELLEFMVFLT